MALNAVLKSNDIRCFCSIHIMKKIILILMMLITGSMIVQEVLHTLHLTNTKSNEDFIVEIMEVGDEYFLKSIDQEGMENKVVEPIFLRYG